MQAFRIAFHVDSPGRAGDDTAPERLGAAGVALWRSMMMRVWWERAALPVALVLALAACGTGQGSGSDVGGTPPDAASADVVADAVVDLGERNPDVPGETGPDTARDVWPADGAASDLTLPDDDGTLDLDVGPAQDVPPAVDAPDPTDAPDTQSTADAEDAPDASDNLEPQDAAEDEGAPACGGLVHGTDPNCQDCLDLDCCDAFRSCAQDATCRSCVVDGVTSNCMANTPWLEAVTCIDDRCATECAPPPVGLVCDSGFATGDAECGTCLTAGCCDAYQGCTSDLACLRCLNDETAIGCDANTLYRATFDCRARECAVACDVEPPPDPGAICTSGMWAMDVPCGNCAGTNCCEWFLNCAYDAVCRACWEGTSTFGCTENPWLEAVKQCVSRECNPTCGGLLGGTCGTDTWIPGTQACNDCAHANCCGPYGACTADDTCLGCLFNPSGCVPNVLRDAVDACLDTACADFCN